MPRPRRVRDARGGGAGRGGRPAGQVPKDGQDGRAPQHGRGAAPARKSTVSRPRLSPVESRAQAAARRDGVADALASTLDPGAAAAAAPAPAPAAAAAEPEPAAEPAPAAAPKWTVGEVNKMTVPKLKAALTELGLATDGLKKVLKERLLAAL